MRRPMAKLWSVYIRDGAVCAVYGTVLIKTLMPFVHLISDGYWKVMVIAPDAPRANRLAMRALKRHMEQTK